MKWITCLINKLIATLAPREPECQPGVSSGVTLVDSKNTLLVEPNVSKLDINALLELGVVKKGKHYYNLDGVRVIPINGEYLTFKEVSVLYGINRGTLYSRYNRGCRGLDLVSPLVKVSETT